MNEDINIQVHETSESQLVDADRSEHIQPIIKPGTQLSLASLFKRVSRPLSYFIISGLLICWLFYNTMNTNNHVSMKPMNRGMLLFPTSNQIRQRPTLAIVMAISTDRINGSVARVSVARVSVANKRNYVKKHGYEFILDTVIDGTRSVPWARIVTLHAAMHSRPDIEWFWHLDMDAFILEKQIDIYDHVIKKYQWGLEKDKNITKDLLMSCDCSGLKSFNGGCKSTLRFLKLFFIRISGNR
jgi:hypothetical protein